MKGKQNKKRLKPILKKSMLTALGLGIALPLGGTLPQADAGAIGPVINISQPVLNDGINWLSYSSKPNDPSLRDVPIEVTINNIIRINLSTQFRSDEYSPPTASSSDNSIAEVYVETRQDENMPTPESTLVVIPRQSGTINIELKANYMISGAPETVTDNIELYISKKGDVNADGKVNSLDAVDLFNYIRNMMTRRSFSYVEMNRMDVDRNTEPTFGDMDALLKGYKGKTLGGKNNDYVLTFKQVDDAPYVLNGQLKDYMESAVAVDYYLMDIDYDDTLNTPSYQWYRATDALGEDRVPIVGETREQHSVTSEDENHYLVLEVITHSTSNPNTEPRRTFIVGKEKIQLPD
ncbi:dockerin type I domain-containing protein [Paenibacillus sp. 1781tsa1]|uniref:dockerin type I domain-containing protein n=1 Tax=Paenibacillus sp. 1781tsa1 TaxID=2953810 RepID=UPI0020A04A3E|nr:dockerin type I domain-containing protein [Paenibacillus sp. 1781tsa1]MCP1183944.1 dockerin type I domain-containing protein [Paenibacillus sp. 1781tsa1]